MSLPIPDRLDETILVTHHGCMDGAGCAILFLLAGGKKENIRYVAAGMVENFVKKDPAFQSDNFIIFADVGLNSPKYADVLEKRGNLVMLDHHNTSLHLDGRYWAQIERENQRCGTRMLLDYLVENSDRWEDPETGFSEARRLKSSSYRNFADVIDDHDRWVLNLKPMSEDLAAFMVFVGQDDFVKRFRDPKERICDNIAKGRGKKLFTEFEDELLVIINRRRDEAIEQALKKAVVRDTTLPDGSRVKMGCVVTAEPNISLLLNKMLESNPEIDVAVSVCLDKGSVSFRSRGGKPDVSQIAGQFGGGGHKAAAGHRLPPNMTEFIIEEIYG